MFRTIAVLAALAAVSLSVVLSASARSDAVTVKVTAKDFKFVLSRKTAPHGVVKFVVVNRGRSAHDFKIAGKKTPLLKPGKSRSFRVTLKKGRRYAYLCTVPGHAQLGMKGRFRST